jgi:hypothetical protein
LGVIEVFAGNGRPPIRYCLHPKWVKTPSHLPCLAPGTSQDCDAFIIWMNFRHEGNSLQTVHIFAG